MRELKFRAKRKDTGQWLFWNLLDGFSNPKDIIDEKTIGQLIGIGRDDKEIYEGDFINWAGLTPIKIVWEDSGFQGKLYSSTLVELNAKALKMFGRVIGNIYDNPELKSKNENPT